MDKYIKSRAFAVSMRRQNGHADLHTMLGATNGDSSTDHDATSLLDTMGFEAQDCDEVEITVRLVSRKVTKRETYG
jgi:S-formylglutathione hydrolase FrmB